MSFKSLKSVPEGYKNSEIGIIPDNWDIISLGELASSVSVGLVINPSSYFDEKGSIPMLVGSAVKENKINWDKCNLITEDSNQKIMASRLYEGDLVTVRVGEPGITAVIPKELNGCNCASMMIIRKGSAFNSTWLCFIMNSDLGISQIRNVQYGTAQKQFNISDAIHFLYPFPQLEEQTAIANALLDVDNLINSLEKLIAKKQAIKVGAMQQLLTGKKRLPPFDQKHTGYKQTELGKIPKDWDVQNIESFTGCTAGGTPNTGNSNYWGGENPWMSSGELHLKRVYDVEKRITDEGLLNSSTKIIPKNCVLIGLAGQGKTRGTVAINKIKLCTNQSIAAIFPSKKYITEYLFYYLQNRYEELRSMSTGDGGRGGLNLSIIKKIHVILPSIDEQKFIAQVLVDIDDNINFLHDRLHKTKQLKQGMMQELLTGRTRLI